MTIVQIFGVPPGARRAKPFIDHILTFSVVDNKIWFRNFQVGHGPFFLLAISLNVPPRLWKRILLSQTGPLLRLSLKSALDLSSLLSGCLKGRLGEQLYTQTPVSLVQVSDLTRTVSSGIVQNSLRLRQGGSPRDVRMA